MNLSPNEDRVLRFLAKRHGEGGYYSFAPIVRATKLERNIVRRACRSLARKELAVFERGLWTEEGEPAGSGYAATDAGRELVNHGASL